MRLLSQFMASAKKITRSRSCGVLQRSVMETLESRVLLSGNGLLAQYYNGNSFTGPGITRNDPTVNFSWTNGAPDNSMPIDGYSAQWTGQVVPLYSQTYTFSITAQGGALLNVNGTTLISQLAATSGTWNGNIALTAGTKYSITVQYAEKNATNSGIALSWQSTSQALQVIPQSQLYSFSDTDLNMGAVGNSSYNSTTGALTLQGGLPNTVGIIPMHGENAGHIVSQQITGDVEIVARLTAKDSGAYAGISIIDGLTTGSNSASIISTNNNSIWTMLRGAPGYQLMTGSVANPPVWLKLVRIGNTFTQYTSPDGKDWSAQNFGNTVTMNSTVSVGFFVAGPSNSTLSSATFDNIRISSPQLDYTTSWIGNNFSGIGAVHVANDIKAMYIGSDGTVYANSPYDEGGYEAAIYKDGQVVSPLLDGNGGSGSLHGWGRAGGFAIGADANYIYVGISQANPGWSDPAFPAAGHTWYCVRRYSRSNYKVAPFSGGAGSDNSMLIVNTDAGDIRGIWLSGGNMYVADKGNNLVKVYSTSTMTLQSSFSVNSPQQIAEDSTGNLWIISNPSSGSASILCYSKAGVQQSKSITDVPTPTSIYINPANGQLLVTDDGPSQQIISYSVTGTSASRVTTYGSYGGIGAGTPGQITPTKFDNPMAVGADASGNIYITFDGIAPYWTTAIGTGVVLRSLSPTMTQNWELHGMEFVDTGTFDPADDGVSVFTKDEQWSMNYNTTSGEMGTLIGDTVDELTYNGDPRVTGTDTQVWIQNINGQKLMFATGQGGGSIGIYRQVSVNGGMLFKYCGFLNIEGVSSLGNHAGVWHDLNNDGQIQTTEWTDLGIPGISDTFGDQVDSQGNIWLVSQTQGVFEAKFLGLDANGAPFYSSQLISSGLTSPFTLAGRSFYDPATDTMYQTGFTAANPRTDNGWGEGGSELVRYNNWSTNPTQAWRTVIPYTPATTQLATSLSVAGNRAFVDSVSTGTVYAFDISTGQLVMDMYRGPEVGGLGGWIDDRPGISAFRRSNGEYEIISEDDLLSKQIIFRAGGITPTNLTATTVTQGQITLSWTDTNTKETGIVVQQSTDGVNFSTIATLPANMTSYGISGLTTGTTYYYRVKATNAFDDSPYSTAAQVLFTTTTAPTNVVATGGSGQIALTWTDNATTETAYKIDRASDPAFSQGLTTTTLAANQTSYTDTSVVAAATYYYRVYAMNGAANLGYSLTVKATVNAVLPATPSGLLAIPASNSSIALTWRDNSNNETGFKLERATDANFTQNLVQVNYTTAGMTGFTDTNLATGTTYYYRVRAVNAVGNSAYSLSGSATTLATPVQLTGTPIGTPNTSYYAGSPASSFDGNYSTFPDDVNANGWVGLDLGTPCTISSVAYAPRATLASRLVSGKIQVSNVADFSTATTVYTVTTTPPEGTLTTVNVNVSGAWRYVRFLTAAGYANVSELRFWGNTPTAAPTGVTLTSGSDTGTPGDNITSLNNSSAGQKLSFTVTGTVSGATVNLFANTQFIGSAVAAGTTTTVTTDGVTSLADGAYSITAQQISPGSLSSSASSAGSITILSVPTAPSGLTATAISQTQINLAWTDNASSETGFKVERATDSGFTANLTLLTTTAANITSYNDTGLTASTTYYYRVRATNLGGDSANSAAANATTQSAGTVPTAPSGLTATTISQTQINLAWTDNSNNETGFKVERATDSGFTTNLTLVTTTAANATSYNNTGLTANTLYYYRVRATNGTGDSANTTAASATTLPNTPAAPSGLTATAYSSSQINLAWTDNSNNETGFKVERATDSGFTTNLMLVTTTAANATSYSNTGLTASTTYYYRIRATNTGGDSANSSTASATTTSSSKLSGTIIGTIASGNPITNAFDGNFTTFVDAPLDTGWAGLDLGSSNTITAVKYAPRSGQEARMVGGYFQVSNIADFSTATTIYTITAAPTAGVLTTQTVSVSGTWQYVRYVSPSGGWLNVSELEFWGTAATGGIAPVAPTTLTATTASTTQINLAWVDNSNNETGFKVERATDSGFTTNLTLVTTTAANATSYNDTTVTSGTRYYYRVRATNATGDSVNCVPVTAIATVSTKQTGTIIDTAGATYSNGPSNAFDGNLTTFVDSNSASGWIGLNLGNANTAITALKFAARSGLEFRMQGGYFQVSNVSDFSTATTVYTLTETPASGALTTVSLNVSGTWQYLRYVSPYAGYVNIAELEFWGYTAVTAPGQVTGLSAAAVSSSQINLSWTATSGATSYNIYRATTTGGEGSTPYATGIATTSYSDTGLTANTTYYYTVAAVNAGGTGTQSAESSTTTLPNAPAAPSGLSATSISQTQINLAWTDNSSNETGFKVERATDSGFTTNLTLVTTTAANATSYSNTGLTANTQYYYRVRATNTGGDSANSASANATTLPNAPSAPSGLSATTASQTQINLAWTDNSTNETGFKVERATDSGFTTNLTLVTTTAANATSYSNTGLTANTQYYYRVRATNTGGDSANSASANATTLPNAPAAPSGLSATTISQTQINLAWTDNANNETGFKVERATDSGFTTNLTLVTTTAANAVSYNDTGVVAGTQYYYRVRATNTGGDSANSASANATTLPNAPSAPSGLSATTISQTQINLAWTDNSTNETGFKVERATDSGFTTNLTLVTTTAVNAISYSDTGVVANTQYYYRVRATNTGGDSANSASANATTLPNAPSAPSGLSATTISQTQINLAWTDNSSNETGFKVERATDSAFTVNLTLVTTTAANAISYNDTGVVANTQYYYRVRATNTGGDSVNSASANATTLPNAPSAPSGLSATTISQTQINLAWTDNSSNETGFKVERATDSGFTTNLTLVTTTAANATSYSNTGLTANTQYYYRVRATNTGGDSANSASANATTLPNAPSAPSGLSATSISQTQINLAWTDNSNNETGFKVERATDSGFTTNLTLVTTTAANAVSYSNTGLTANTQYYYRVRATNTGGDSANSASANATTLPNAPAAPSGLSATTISQTQINLAWTDNASNETGVKVERATDSGFTTNLTLVTTTAANAVSYNDTGVVAGTQYYYRVRATNTGGDSANSASANATTLLNAPTGLAATAASTTQINLSWTALSGATSYSIYRSTTPGGEGSTPIVTGIATTSYSNTGLTAGTTYYYKIAAVNAGGTGAQSSEASAITIPAQATGLTANAISGTQINLSWTATTGAATYNVYRSTSPGGEGSTAFATGIATTSYSNTGLSGNTAYYYTVAAVNAGGTGSQSTEATATTATVKLTGTVVGTLGSGSGNPIANAFDGNLTTFFDAPTGNGWAGLDLGSSNTLTAVKYAPRSGQESRMVGGYFQVSNIADFSTATTIFTIASTPSAGSLTTQTVSVSGTWQYVRYVGPSGGYGNVAELEFWGGPASGSTAPVAPTVLTASTASTTQINLAWVDNSSNETGFKVERATDSAFTQNLTLVTTTAANATSYNNTGLTSGTRYYYRVRATNATGDSVNCVSVTALATVSSKQTGTVIYTSGATYNGTNVAANAFDGSLSTFVDSTSASGWVGLDLGSAKTITTIKFASRSGLEYRMQGGYFQVSNAADFSTATTIYTISGDAPPSNALTTINLNVSGTWRYIRYVSPTGGYVNISEMEAWGF